MANTFWKIYFFLHILINLKTTISKEVVIKSGNMKTWFHKSLSVGKGESGKIWYNPKEEEDCNYTCSSTCGGTNDNYLLMNHVQLGQIFADFIHVDIEAEFTKNNTQNYSQVLEVYLYRGNKTGGDVKEGSEFLSKTFTRVFAITCNATMPKRGRKKFSFKFKGTEGVRFAIKSTKACAKIFSMKLYYYYCEVEFINSVKFENTTAPLNGSKKVTGKCSNHTSFFNTSLKGFCQSNGSWILNRNVNCSCDKGFEPTSSRGCLRCSDNYIKPKSSNEKCIKCPSNSVHTVNKTSCKCKEGYYRQPDDPNDPLEYCHGLVKLKLKCDTIATFVNITWKEPRQHKTTRKKIDEPLKYDVMCNFCVDKQCNRTCENVNYHPGSNNLSQTFVKVSNLQSGVKYVFKVYPKIHQEVGREKFNLTETECIVDNSIDGKKEKNDYFLIYLLVGVSVCVLLFNAITILIIVILRRRSGSQIRGHIDLSDQVQLLGIGYKVYMDPSNYERAEDALAEFTTELDRSVIFLETLIGGGEFGNVYKGQMTCHDGKTISVAVKTLKHDATAKSAKDFTLEASIMGQFHDPNVVRLEGVVTKSIPRMIVIEFMSNGSLEHFLKNNNGNLTQLQLVEMAKGVASGMKYLAGINFVHRDLASRNILVDEKLLCKISDFGLSRVLDIQESSRGEYSTTGGKIPIRWTAPEAIKFRRFSSASDVWSFGILLWEIMTFSERPYWDWDNFRVMREIEIGYRLPAPKDCPRALHELMLQCWHEDRSERPTFEHITLLISSWISSPEDMQKELELDCSAIYLNEWLHSIKMGNYTSHFIGAGFESPYELSGLSDEDLREMGITLIGHRNKILKGIKALDTGENGNAQVER